MNDVEAGGHHEQIGAEDVSPLTSIINLITDRIGDGKYVDPNMAEEAIDLVSGITDNKEAHVGGLL